MGSECAWKFSETSTSGLHAKRLRLPSKALHLIYIDIVQAPTHAFFYDLYHEFDKFREDFDAKNNKSPYVSPMLRWRWSALQYHSNVSKADRNQRQIAQTLTLDQKEDAIKRLKTFKKWFLDEVMCVYKYTSFMAFPIEEMAPRYRDEPPPCVTRSGGCFFARSKMPRSPTMPKGIGMLDIAPTLGAPELVIPSK